MGTLIPDKRGMKLLSNEPKGIGGWLVLVQILLFLTIFTWTFSVIRFFLASGGEVWDRLTSPDSNVYDPLWKPTLIFELAGNAVFILFAAFLVVWMYRKKASFPRWIILFYAANTLFHIVDYVLLTNIPLLAEFGEDPDVQSIGRSLVLLLVWIPYFIRSRRVRNTFIN
jgi:hypothetical protein